MLMGANLAPESPKSRKFPVNSLFNREFGSERGSLETASTANNFCRHIKAFGYFWPIATGKIVSLKSEGPRSRSGRYLLSFMPDGLGRGEDGVGVDAVGAVEIGDVARLAEL